MALTFTRSPAPHQPAASAHFARDDAELNKLAEAFAPPVILTSKLRDGSLRQCAMDEGVRVLLYEGGEALAL